MSGAAWQCLPIPWQIGFEEAWLAYCAGAPPVGAAITSARGEVIARGRNRIKDESRTHPLAGLWIAHAEIDVLTQQDCDVINRDCTLWTTLEPCCMCMGAIRMAHIGRVEYVLQDFHGGGSSLADATPYFRRAKIRTSKSMDRKLEEIMLALMLGWNFQSGRYPGDIAELWRQDCPMGIELSLELHREGRLVSLRASQAPAEQVFQVMAGMFA